MAPRKSFYLNRQEIRTSLGLYQRAKNQHEAILLDKAIQLRFEMGHDDEAESMILAKYPQGSWNTVRNHAFNLVAAMFRNVPGPHPEPEEFFRHVAQFEALIALAKEV